MDKLHYLRQLHTNKILPNITVDENGCHLLDTHKTRDGYARVFITKYYEGVDTKMGAHRLTYQAIHNILLPSDIHVLHKCDVRNCVNPEHLFQGSNYTNVVDKMNKGRMPCQKGTKNPNCILTEKQVLEIYSNKFYLGLEE